MMYCDAMSSFGMINFTKGKSLSELKSTFKTWILTANRMGFKMELLNGDSDSIFENQKLVQYLNDHGIQVRYAPRGLHGKNGLVERMIQTVTSGRIAQLVERAL